MKNVLIILSLTTKVSLQLMPCSAFLAQNGSEHSALHCILHCLWLWVHLIDCTPFTGSESSVGIKPPLRLVHGTGRFRGPNGVFPSRAPVHGTHRRQCRGHSIWHPGWLTKCYFKALVWPHTHAHTHTNMLSLQWSGVFSAMLHIIWRCFSVVQKRKF